MKKLGWWFKLWIKHELAVLDTKNATFYNGSYVRRQEAFNSIDHEHVFLWKTTLASGTYAPVELQRRWKGVQLFPREPCELLLGELDLWIDLHQLGTCH